MKVLNLRSAAIAPGDYASQLVQARLRDPAWFLVYAVQDAPTRPLMAAIAQAYPHVPVFGATTFQGCFSPSGFERGCVVLAVERDDQIRAAASMQSTTEQDAAEASRRAADEVVHRLGTKPDTFLLHSTPGYEERILEGIGAASGSEIPVYGGSAADDDIAGRWSVFADGVTCSEGFVLIGLVSANPILSGFVGGYLPTGHSGVISRADGRTVHEIDGRPAAIVYNEWTGGAIEADVASGGNVLLKTNMLPVARSLGESQGVPRRLLAHPHEVRDQQALHFFSEFSVGERVTLMTSSAEPLITRVRRVVERARRGHASPPRGGLLIYCAGCLTAVLERAPEIAGQFQLGAGKIPFVGSATFGEQGCFYTRGESRHGNLMCSVLLF